MSASSLDLGVTTAKTLVKRHTTPEPYAIARTREMREMFVPPRSWRPTP